MAKGFKKGAGGANPLSFKVVGGTKEPAKSSRLVFWVNTDKKITSWTFSATEPEERSEGMVWLVNGTESLVEINALKKNGIQLYPVSAKQYINGVWTEKPVKVSQNESWSDLIRCLFNAGEVYTVTTGGYATVSKLGDYTENCGGYADIENDVISVSAYAHRAAPETCFGQATEKKINLTGVSSIRIVGSCTSGRSGEAGAAGVGVRVVSTQSLSDAPAAEKTITSEGAFDTSLDVINLSGEYYIIFYAFEYLNGGYSNAYTGSGVFTQALCQ